MSTPAIPHRACTFPHPRDSCHVWHQRAPQSTPHALCIVQIGGGTACHGVALGWGWWCLLRLAKGAAEELLAQAEALGAVEQWQEPTSLRHRWRDAGYAAAWAPGGHWAGGGAGAAEGEEGVSAGWAHASGHPAH